MAPRLYLTHFQTMGRCIIAERGSSGLERKIEASEEKWVFQRQIFPGGSTSNTFSHFEQAL